MKKQLSILKIMFVTLFSFFSLTFINAQDFDFTVTDANMTIQVSAEICSSVMDEGDLLGAFFTNPSGDLQCAGFQTFSGDQLAIAVMASESGLFNGYATGDNFQWAFYDQSESATVLLDSEMNSSPPFSSTFIANGFGQILSLSVATGTDCEDDNTAMAAFGGCIGAVTALGCDFVFMGTAIGETCPVTCNNCDGGSAPVLGCTNSDALNYDSSATEDDGSCLILGCTCEIAINYNADANLDDSSCVVLSGCADPTAENYSGDNCSSNDPINNICEYAPVDVSIGPFEYEITDANMTVQLSGSAATWNGGSPPPNGSLIGAFFTNNDGELQCAGYSEMTGEDQYAIAVWASESGLDNGFAAGEEFTWILSYGGESFIADSFVMNSNPPFSTTFVANGFGQILSVNFSGEISEISGCTDNTACNYNADATVDDGSCTMPNDCGSCEGDLSCLGCTDATACNYDSSATVDNGNCTYADSGYDCNGVCLNDVDGDGVCDEFEVGGCTDATACNYDSSASDDNGSCTYADSGYDCNGVCLNDVDGDGVCDEFEVGGCTDATACNYDSSATDDNGSCTYADSGYDCNGVCLNDVDGDGVCDEFEEGGCTDATACNYDASATEDNGTCTYADSGYDCNGVCLNDVDGDGVCDEFEVGGCTDATACNYDSSATDDNGSCTYADSGYDCNGICLNDVDGDGVCDEFEVGGCTDATACNYDSSATDDNGSCTYADSGYDCNGVCLNDVDGDGVCDEFEVGGCTDATACNYDSSATDDNGSCTYADSGYDCNGICLNDVDGDGVCDEFEVSGCTNELAINYNPLATDEDGTCTYDCNLVDLFFTWDAYVNENQFTVNDLSGSLILSGNATETIFSDCLNPGVYVINITDSFGDGVINGNVLVTDNGEEVELYPSSSFDGTWSETSIYFAVGGAVIVPGCMNPDAENYNADANIDYLQECEFPAEAGPDWVVISTDPSSSHIIGLMPGSNFSIDGVELTAGSYIGVFYTDDNGEWACGGFTEWDGPGSVGVISAQMDDSTTDEKDGFSEENLYILEWSQDFICEYSDATNAVYSEQDFFFTSDDGLFASNGISGLMGFGCCKS